MTITLANTIGIYVIEEQEIYHHIYRSILEPYAEFKLLGVFSVGNIAALKETLATIKPDILLIGVKNVNPDLLDTLEQVHSDNDGTGLVLLVTSVSDDEINYLRKLVQKWRSSIAIYLKGSLDYTGQLHGIILSVSLGQVSLDSSVANFIMLENNESPLMKMLTDVELDVLNLLQQGFTNQGIAEFLAVDIKTIKYHIHNIYNKLKEDGESSRKPPHLSSAWTLLEPAEESKTAGSKDVQAMFPLG